MTRREIIIDGDVARIPLSQGLEATADAADAALLGAFTWSAAKSGGNMYAVTRVGKQTVYMKSLLMRPPPKRRVKSLGHTLDCRRSQLRITETEPRVTKHSVRLKSLLRLRRELLLAGGDVWDA